MHAISLNAISKKMEASAVKLQKLYGQSGDEVLLYLADQVWQLQHAIQLQAKKHAANKTL